MHRGHHGKDKGEEMRQGGENGLASPTIPSKEKTVRRKAGLLTVISAMLERYDRKRVCMPSKKHQVRL